MIKRLDSGRWQARHRPVPGGKQVARNFNRKLDAQRWLDEQKAAVITGQYVDPNAGKVTFWAYAEQWRAAQVHRPSSAAHVETMLRRHAYPTFGDRPIGSILPSEVQAWVRRLELAPSTVGVVHGIVSTVMKSAIRDRRILANPCEGTRLPRAERDPVVPPTTEQVLALREAVPPRLQTLVTFAAGMGPRQGEALGATVDRLHMLRREFVIDRQLVTQAGATTTFGPPKTKASRRRVPMPLVVVDAVAEHLATYGPGEHGLVFTDERGRGWTRQAFGRLWRPAAVAAGLDPGTGMHALRHYYASLLIEHGESVKVVQARLGHATAAETLDTYAHLWPESDDRTRAAVDAVLSQSSGRPGEVQNSPDSDAASAQVSGQPS